MAAHPVNDDREFMWSLLDGLGQAIAGALQQQENTSQAQLQQLIQAQAEMRQQTGHLLEVLQQQQQQQQQHQQQ